MAHVRKHVLIEGIVQGVSFRKAMKRVAAESGVTGWVKNLPNGSVVAVFEGEEAPVREVSSWCFIGPVRADVTKVLILSGQYSGEFRGFSIEDIDSDSILQACAGS